MSSTVKMIVLLALIAIVFITGLVFYLRNEQMVAVDYLLGSLKLSLSTWLLLVLVAGVLLGWLTSLPVIFKLKRQNSRLSRQVKVTEKEINNLRVLPVKDTH